MPKVFEHFQELAIPTDIYASNWFITLFSNDVPFDMAPAVIDIYLLEGKKGLLRIALGLLSFLEEEVLHMKYDDLMVFMSHPSSREEFFRKIDQHSLFSKASTFKITNDLLNELERLSKVNQNLLPPMSNYNSRNTGGFEDLELAEFRDKFESFRHFKRL